MKPQGEALFRYYDGGVYITGWGFILMLIFIVILVILNDIWRSN